MTTDFDLTTFKALSFDCYGTLIDWEAGIAAVLVPWAREQGLDLTDEQLLLAYADNEAAVERDTPAALYPEVLATAFRATGDRLGRAVSDEWAQRLGNLGPGLAGVPRLRRRPGPSGPALPADHPVQCAPRRRSPAATGGCTVISPPSSPPRTSAPTSRRRPTSAPGTPRCAVLGVARSASCCRRPGPVPDTSRPSARGCRRSGSTGVTTGPGGGPPRNPPRNGPTTSSSPRWPTSPTPSTGPSPLPTPRADPQHLARKRRAMTQTFTPSPPGGETDAARGWTQWPASRESCSSAGSGHRRPAAGCRW